MFKKSKADNFYLYSTDVENFFISDFMLKAPGEYVKAYLLALMYAQLNEAVGNHSIKEALGMTEEEMDACWDYWEEQGLLQKVNDPLHPESGYDLVFVNLRELIGQMPASAQSRDVSALDDKELALLYKEIQKATGRMLENREFQEIANWLTELPVTTDLILYCYKYCAQNRRSSSYRYVSTVLRDWVSQGIRTEEDAQAVLSAADRKYASYKAVFQELGFSRNPSAEEKRMMDGWFLEQGYSMNDVLHACRQTVSIPNPNLKYVDSVLRNMKGKRSEEEIKVENVAVRLSKLYDEIRQKNETLTRRRQVAVYKAIPKMEGVMKAISDESIALSMALVRRDGTAQRASREKITALKEEKNRLLQAAGFEINALDAVYDCSECKDTGLLEDGSRCHCYAEKLEKINGKQFK